MKRRSLDMAPCEQLVQSSFRILQLEAVSHGIVHALFGDRSLQIYLLEFHKKFSIPAGCLAFVIFAFPVGYFARRSGRSIGFGIGLIVSVLYWSLLFAGQTLGLRLDFSPFWSMWLPNILLVLMGGSFFIMGFKR